MELSDQGNAMKRLLTLLALFLLVLPAPLMAASWWRAITVEWQYTPPIEPAVEAFVLYRENTEVCRFEGATTRTGMCDVILTAESSPFSLAVQFVDGTYSPRSNILPLIDAVPAPVNSGLCAVLSAPTFSRFSRASRWPSSQPAK